jgi:NitT/TauT family transport system substrate-binding protein
LNNRKAVIDRFMKAYRETVDWMYSDPAAIPTYAVFVSMSEERAKRTRNEFFPKTPLDPDKVVGLAKIMPDAVALKFFGKSAYE